MSQNSTIVNRVAQSSLLTIDLDSYFPTEDFITVDLKDFLFKGIILKEKEFRLQVKNMDWTVYKDKLVNVYCSEDAIVPMWAYMLIGSKIVPLSSALFYGSVNEAREKIAIDKINSIDTQLYDGKSIVIKGCGEEKVSPQIYIAITEKLLPLAKSLMFGEPCSTVPIYKKSQTPSK